MSLAPLLNASFAIQLHTLAAAGALLLGALQLARVKGTGSHRLIGWAWAGMVTVTALTAFWIHELKVWGAWSPIHILAVSVLAVLPFALHAARQGNRRRHATIMLSLYVGGLIAAGAFTLVPGRILHRAVFGG
ncbi:MAG: DUF2306 domain-containing protein [Alphaproteobacteria bacterium]|nr:DUF2306 domain-containing protein [Alphaproteobacteria bacterium]